MKRYLISVCTPNYVQRATPYFQSLPLVRSVEPRVVLLDFNPATDCDGRTEQALRSAMPYVDFRKMDLPASHSNYMIQHGVFLDAVPEVNSDDLVILTDMDIRIQRDFTKTELEWMDRTLNDVEWSGWDVAASWNAGPSDTLVHEAVRIGLSEDWIREYEPKAGLESVPCMNCGVLVARASVFRAIRKVYEERCDEFYAATAHRSRCQFLLNWCFYWLRINVHLLPPAIHQHGHCRVDGDALCSPGTELRMGVLVNNGDPVVFRHAL